MAAKWNRRWMFYHPFISKPQKKFKAAAGKSAKPIKAKGITPSQARRLAGECVANQMFKDAQVVYGAKARLVSIYINEQTGQPLWKTTDIRVVYKNPERLGDGMITLKSAAVVLLQTHGPSALRRLGRR